MAVIFRICLNRPILILALKISLSLTLRFVALLEFQVARRLHLLRSSSALGYRELYFSCTGVGVGGVLLHQLLRKP